MRSNRTGIYRIIVLAVLGLTVLSSFSGFYANQTPQIQFAPITPSAVNAASPNYYSNLSYAINPGNSSILGPNSNTSWKTTGNSLIQKLSGLNIPDKAKILPNFDVAPQKIGSAYIPSYSAGPAPVGIGSYGVKNVSGNLVPYSYSTSGFEGSFTIYNESELSLGLASPSSYGIQLNAVLNNVTLFGNQQYQYWTQNVVLYTGSNHTLTFIDNIWNFTSPSAVINGNEFYNYNGTVVPGTFYYTIGPTVSVTFPFTVNLYLNSTNVGGRNTVFFNYSVSTNGHTYSNSYDEVQFNSTTPGSINSASPASYEVSGNTLTGTGFIPMDAEIVIGGPGGGSTAVFQNINATMNLNYLNSQGQFKPVGSAYSAGSETGETSSGVSVSYSGTTAYLDSGPTFVNPLWNLTANQHYYSLTGVIAPSNAFVLMNNGTSFENTTTQWSPVNLDGSFNFTLPSGNYSLEVLMSYHDPVFMHIDLNGNISLGTLTLPSDPAMGLYTPLYAFNNAQLKNLSVSGTGTSSSPFLIQGPLYNGGSPAYNLNTAFTQFNDYLFATFNGILVSGTTDYAVFTGFQTSSGNPVFSVIYPHKYLNVLTNYFGVSSGNYLNIAFYNTSHIILNNSVISGWFSSIVYSNLNQYNIPVIGSLILWNATDSLIEHNTFLSQGSGILVYGPYAENLNNKIWNNTFDNSNSIPMGAYYAGAPIGITLAGSGNTVYNNAFYSVIPVVSIGGTGADIYTGGSAAYFNHFNITRTSASQAYAFDGTSLSGSIIGNSYQGGNYYYNYFGNGTQAYNGTGVGFAFTGQDALNGSISYTYDYSPLVMNGYKTNVSSSGLPGATATYYDINNAIYTISPGGTSTLYLPNGSYDIQGFILYNPQIEFLPQSVLGSVNLTLGYMTVSGPLMNLTIEYSLLYNLTVEENGLPNGTLWGFSLPGAGIGYTLTNQSQSLYVLPGSYYLFPQAVEGYYATPETFTLSNPSQVFVTYSPYIPYNNGTKYNVTFNENGLASGTIWGVQIEGHNYETTNSTLELIGVPVGTYNFTVLGVTGYSSPVGGVFTSGPGNTTLYITYVKSQSSSGTYLMMAAGVGIGLAVGAAVMYLRQRKP